MLGQIMETIIFIFISLIYLFVKDTILMIFKKININDETHLQHDEPFKFQFVFLDQNSLCSSFLSRKD